MSDHNKNCECEECCEHGDIPECGYCIDCGAYVLDNYDNEPELNKER
jgi:hypothetical protein